MGLALCYGLDRQSTGGAANEVQSYHQVENQYSCTQTQVETTLCGIESEGGFGGGVNLKLLVGASEGVGMSYKCEHCRAHNF